MNFKILLVIILFAALVLRLIGLNYGLPYFFVGDEQVLVNGALKMAEIRTLFPVFYPEEFRPLYYPPLLPYIYLIFLSPILLIRYFIGDFANIIEFKNFLILNPGFVWSAARILNIFFALGSLFVTYLIAKKIFNEKVGLIAVLFLSLSFFHLQLSHFTRHWIPAVFFTHLIILEAFYLFYKPKRKYYIWSGILTGLAFGASYIAAFGAWFVILGHFLSTGIVGGQGRNLKDKLKDLNLWIFLLISAALSSVFIILHPQEFFSIIIGEDGTVGAVKSITGLLTSFVYYFKILIYQEPAILIFSLLGFVALAFASKKLFSMFLSFCATYIFALYFLFHDEPRYVFFLLPILSLAAAYGLNALLEKMKAVINEGAWRRYAFAAVLLLIFLFPVLVSIKYTTLMTQKDTRIMAKQWIEEHIQERSKIAARLYNFKPLTPTKEAIAAQQSLDPDSLRTVERVLLTLDPANYPKPAFDVLNLHFIKPELLPKNLVAYLKDNNFKYFIVEYWSKSDLTAEDLEIMNQDRLAQRFDAGIDDLSYNINGNLEESVWVMFSMKRPGPIIEIYEL